MLLIYIHILLFARLDHPISRTPKSCENAVRWGSKLDLLISMCDGTCIPRFQPKISSQPAPIAGDLWLRSMRENGLFKRCPYLAPMPHVRLEGRTRYSIIKLSHEPSNLCSVRCVYSVNKDRVCICHTALQAIELGYIMPCRVSTHRQVR